MKQRYASLLTPVSLLFVLLLGLNPQRVEGQCLGSYTSGAYANPNTVAIPAGNWAAPSVPPNMTATLNLTTTAGSNTATVGTSVGLTVGMSVSGPNLPPGTTITGIVTTTLTLSQNATGTGSGIPHFFTLPAYAASSPPINAGSPSQAGNPGLHCSVCPATFTASACANHWFNFYMCAGNTYEISLCGSTPAWNSSITVTSTDGLTSYGFDDDGCGIPNGLSTITVIPSISATYRIRILNSPCTPSGANCGTLVVSCTPQPPPPPNDEACGALPLPVGVDCTFDVADVMNGTNSTFANPPAPCGGVASGYVGFDVWYSATVPASGNLRIGSSLISASSIAMAIYTLPNLMVDGSLNVGSTTMTVASTVGLTVGMPVSGPGVQAGSTIAAIVNGTTLTLSAAAVQNQPANCFYFGGALTPLDCDATPPIEFNLSGLTGGSDIYIRVWPQGSGLNQGTFNICVYEPIPPNNDLPCGAAPLPVLGDCVPNMFQTENATPTNLPGLTLANPTCGGAAPFNDVWFSVVVPPSAQMTVTTFAGTLNNMAMAWYRLSPGGQVCNPPGYAGTLTQIACNDDQSGTNLMPRINSQVPTAIPLTPGETIYIRIWPKTGTPQEGTFEICVRENLPPPNDNPCGAIPLPTSLSCNLQAATNDNATLTGTTAPGATSIPVPTCGAPANNDVWYTVTIPAGGEVNINTQQGAGELVDAAMAVYTSTGTCAGGNLALTQVACAVGGSTFNAAMPMVTVSGPVGSVVYVRVWRQTGLNGAFGICARQTVVSATLSGCDVTSYDSGGPNGNYNNNENSVLTFCPDSPGDVVAIAFSFFSTQQGFDIVTIYNGPSTSSPILGQFSGSTMPPGLVSTAVGGCLTVGFVSNGSVTQGGYAFSTSCAPPIPPPPPSYGICNTMFYDTGGPNGNYQNNEFETWTFCSPIPGEAVTITFQQFNVEQGWDFLTVFNGPNVGSPVLGGPFTGAQNPGTFTANNPSGCLTVRFTSDFSIVSTGWAATVRCGPAGPPPPPLPVTGICGSTVYDPGGANGNYPNSINQNPNNQGGNGCWDPPGPITPCAPAGPYPPPPGTWGGYWSQTYCPDIPGDAVTLTFLSFAIEFGWDQVYIYNGPSIDPYNTNGTQFMGPGVVTCGGPAGWCNNTLGPGGYTGTALPGSFTSTHPSGCLTISMTSDDIVTMAGWSALISCQSGFNPNADCFYVLRMYDTYGDGWTGSNLQVTVGATTNYYTIQAGYYNEVVLSLDAGQTVTITYNGVGLFPTDNYWTLDLVGATYSEFHSAIPAVNGQSYTFTVVDPCAVPAAPPEDCVGALNICADPGPPGTNAIPGATHFGSVGDLWAPNYGCLAGTERRGTWQVFGCLTPGDIGFTIIPNTPQNVDFAIWGPYPPGTSIETICIPAGPPIRCSIAAFGSSLPAGTGQTGIGHPTYSAPAQYQPALTTSSQGTGGNGYLPGIQAANVGDVYLMYVSNGVGATGATVTWTGTATMDCEILPVELFAFDATAGESHVDVDWSTVSERNSSHFDVQRSADAVEFRTIGTVPAAGNSTGLMEYRFVDGSPMEGLSYYRLLMVDQDGSSEPSHAVPVIFRRKGGNLEVYPNPVRDIVNVVYTAPDELGMNWRMYDASGRLVMTGNQGLIKGMNRMEIDVQRLDMGSYTIELRGANDLPLGMARFVKQ